MPTSPNSLTMTASLRPLRIRQHVADQRGLSGAEKAGDDRAGDARKRSCHSLISSENRCGGTRAISPRLSASGRPRQGIRPSADAARSCAPSTSASRIRRRDRDGRTHRSRRRWLPHHGAAAALAIGEAAQRLDDDAGVLGRARWWPRRAPRPDADSPRDRPAAGTSCRHRSRWTRSTCVSPPIGLGTSVNVTRAAPRERSGSTPGCSNGVGSNKRRPRGHDSDRPPPGHPARRATELTAGLLARGSPPVTAFPGSPQWHCGTSSPLTVAGAAADLGADPAPHSLFTLHSKRPSIQGL